MGVASAITLGLLIGGLVGVLASSAVVGVIAGCLSAAVFLILIRGWPRPD